MGFAVGLAIFTVRLLSCANNDFNSTVHSWLCSTLTALRRHAAKKAALFLGVYYHVLPDSSTLTVRKSGRPVARPLVQAARLVAHRMSAGMCSTARLQLAHDDENEELVHDCGGNDSLIACPSVSVRYPILGTSRPFRPPCPPTNQPTKSNGQPTNQPTNPLFPFPSLRQVWLLNELSPCLGLDLSQQVGVCVVLFRRLPASVLQEVLVRFDLFGIFALLNNCVSRARMSRLRRILMARPQARVEYATVFKNVGGSGRLFDAFVYRG